MAKNKTWDGKCPECVSAGLKSKVRPKTDIAIPLVHIIPNKFYDEDGKWHNHSRHKSEQYECDQGHLFSVTINTKCWCGHGHNGFMVESNSTLRIDTNGNVGIGDPPGVLPEELHIVGEVHG